MLKMSIDLNQLLPTFIEESLENVEEIEEALLKIDLADIHTEYIDQLFRAAHTIKGNSTIFKFSSIHNLAKALENLLEPIRKKILPMEQQHLNLLLKSNDCLRIMLLEIKKNGKTESGCAKELMLNLTELNQNIDSQTKKSIVTTKNGWIIHFTPKSDTLKRGNRPENIFRELKSFGDLEITCDYSRCPTFSELIPTECYLAWKLKLLGDVSKKDIQEILAWGAEESEIKLEPLIPNNLKKSTETKTSVTPTLSSIRVSTEKIESLMNTIEELVITESVLKQNVKELDQKKLRKFSNTIEDLEQYSRNLQETILRMRMIPIAFATNRFPRMVLELAKQLGKEIDLKISGEQTEIDKTMIEKITDPLMHLIRNAIDHGIETPTEREKNKKNRKGIIELQAYQSGNYIIVEISDDGAGLDVNKIRETAINKGIISKDKILTDDEYYRIIFQPGFSTAKSVTDLSGHGVGLDVVMKNLRDLGGKVDVISIKNVGTTFRLQLPLTLAIIDCQLIKVGTEFYAIPLSAIIEMSQLSENQITLTQDNTLNYTLHEETFKLINLESLFFSNNNQTQNAAKFIIKIKIDETIIGFSCNELLYQQQLVIRNIEDNYVKIPGILGAAVLGSGELALILDAKEIIKLTSNYIEIANKIIESSPTPTEEIKKTEMPSAEYLCFLIDNKEYAFNINDVQEVCIEKKYAVLPFSSSFVKGIIYLRGVIIPIIDPKILLNLNTHKDYLNNIIIVIQTTYKNRNIYVGIIVDSITQTSTFFQDEIESPPEGIQSHAQGIVKKQDKTIILLKSSYFVSFPEQKWSIV